MGYRPSACMRVFGRVSDDNGWQECVKPIDFNNNQSL